jgi:hypothetical protein
MTRVSSAVLRWVSIGALVFAGAFAGGYTASRVIPVAHAQTLPNSAIRGSSFTLVDQQGSVQATLRNSFPGAELILNDKDGAARVTIGPSGIVVRDPRGRTVWTSPRNGGIMPATE